MALIPGEQASFMMKLLEKGVSSKDKQNYEDADRLALMGKRFPNGYISDENATMDSSGIPAEQTIMNIVRGKALSKWGKILKHKKAYEYYPELGEMKTMRIPDEDKDAAGVFMGEGEGVFAIKPEEKLDTLLHESQHGIDFLDRDKKKQYNDTYYVDKWMSDHKDDEHIGQIGGFNDSVGYDMAYYLNPAEVRGRMTEKGEGSDVAGYLQKFNQEVANTLQNFGDGVTADNAGAAYEKWQNVMSGYKDNNSFFDLADKINNFSDYMYQLNEDAQNKASTSNQQEIESFLQSLQ